MKLVSFTVENFRSITTAHKIRTGQTTILIGPNNEGKSNILRALVAAMNVLTRGFAPGVSPIRRLGGHRFPARRFYDWRRDFPVNLQEDQPDEKSKVLLEFQLSPDEIGQFRQEIGSRLNGTLPIRVTFDRNNNHDVQVAKQGTGGKALTAKSAQVAGFVASRLEFQHIPAVRTAQSAQELVDTMVQRELARLEVDQQYRDALKRISDLQRPLLDKLAENIQGTLRKFLPRVKTVSLQVVESLRYEALRQSCEMMVDDGVPTLLQYKGDGVQSLAALGIMRHASQRREERINLVIAIEEPESHLHPKAIHELREVLKELSGKHQVVITTHCPLFVDRSSMDSNILVSGNKARPAKSVEEIREVLGVKAADNLRHAELVLVVEGERDRTGLTPVLSCRSDKLKSALSNGTLVVDSLAGGTNLAYKLGLLRDSLSRYYCVLDDDKCGRDAFAKAKDQGLVDYPDVTFTTCGGMSEAEIEDLYDQAVYAPALKNAFGVHLDSAKCKSNKKWSDRMREAFKYQGKPWDDKVEADAKGHVARAVACSPDAALNKHHQGVVQALIQALETRLG